MAHVSQSLPSHTHQAIDHANDIHVLVGRDMLIAEETADVIHDFWVP